MLKLCIIMDVFLISVNKQEAAKYFKMAVDKGYANSMNNYAVMLKNGEWVPVNKQEAAKYFKMSAE